jgi:hypothetical protein
VSGALANRAERARERQGKILLRGWRVRTQNVVYHGISTGIK